MRTRPGSVELERKQREALSSQRGELWQLAYRGFHVGGRGLIVADGSQPGSAQPVMVRWRSGREMLQGRGNTFGWMQETVGHLRDYDPRTEFVLQYVSPCETVHVYRVRVPPTARASTSSRLSEDS